MTPAPRPPVGSWPPGDRGAGARDRRGRRSRRRALAAGALAVVAVAALVLLALDKIDVAQVGHALAGVRLRWVVVAVGLMASSFAGRAESWFAVLRAAMPAAAPGRRAVMRALLIGMVMSTVAPGRVGEAARTWVIARRLDRPRVLLPVVIGTVISQTLLNVAALVLLAGIALTHVAVGQGRTASVAAALAIPVGIAAAVLGGPRLLRPATRSRFDGVRRLVGWLSGQLMQVRRGLTAFRRPATASHATIAQLTAWALQLGTCYAVLRAVGLGDRDGVAAAAAVLLAVNVTAAVPVTPSNVGVFQATCVAVLGTFGVAAARGIAYGLVLQAVEVFSAMALGLPALLGEGLSWAELRRQTDVGEDEPT